MGHRGFRPSCQMTPRSHLPFPLPYSASWSSTERAALGQPGDRVVAAQPLSANTADESPAMRFQVVQNFFEELRQVVPD